MAEKTAPNLVDVARDAAYVAIGLGVIGFQKAQVRRNELQKQLSEQLTEARQSAQKLGATVEDRVKLVEERLAGLEDQVEQLLDTVEGALPEQARTLFHQAREATREAQTQLRELVGRNGSAA